MNIIHEEEDAQMEETKREHIDEEHTVTISMIADDEASDKLSESIGNGLNKVSEVQMKHKRTFSGKTISQLDYDLTKSQIDYEEVKVDINDSPPPKENLSSKKSDGSITKRTVNFEEMSNTAPRGVRRSAEKRVLNSSQKK